MAFLLFGNSCKWITGFAGCGGVERFRFRKRVQAPLPLSSDVSAHINRHAHEPGFNGLLQIETMKVFVGPQKDLLGRILRVLDRAQQLHR